MSHLKARPMSTTKVRMTSFEEQVLRAMAQNPDTDYFPEVIAAQGEGMFGSTWSGPHHPRTCSAHEMYPNIDFALAALYHRGLVERTEHAELHNHHSFSWSLTDTGRVAVGLDPIQPSRYQNALQALAGSFQPLRRLVAR